MKSTVLFTFDDSDQRESFLKWVEANNEDAIKRISLDPPIKDDSFRECSLYVSGKKLLDGNYNDLNRRFSQEVNVHSATVELKEKRGDDLVVIRRRKQQ